MEPIPTTGQQPEDNPESYAGLTAQEAEKQAKERGWTTVRSLPPGAMITMEYLRGRLNFTVEDGVVLRCWQG